MNGAGVDEAMWEYLADIGRRVLGRPATEAELRAALVEDSHHDLVPPGGVLLVARSGAGEFLGCVGLRLLANIPAAAELKRLYVRAAGRGAGLGRGLLQAAEAAAKALGASRIVCETNTQLTEARALYAKHGYVETAPYEGHGKADHWYAKVLS